MPHLPWEHRLGATVKDGGAVEVRVGAPRADEVKVRLPGREHRLDDAGLGVRAATVEAQAGEDYWYVLDGRRYPDPLSRWQPKGLRGASRVLDTGAFEWSDRAFQAPSLEDLVLYELHIGTFTPAGTFDAAIEHLPALAELGVTAVEVMPIAEFPGAHGWGYDGVYLSAAQSSYGGPDGFQRFVAAAHAAGLAVVLDVVYNHVGASGNRALRAFGPYFTDSHETFWGAAINYCEEDCDPVREWALQSAEGWIRDFHVDGLRLDALHAIFDAGAEHIVAAIARRVHGANHRALVIAESGLNDPKVIRPAAQGGWGCDTVWADDFHHALHALLTGEQDGYYADFGRIAQLVKAFHRPHVHDGSYSEFRRRRFGAPAPDRPPEQFIVFSANHDQVGNRALGDRLPEEVRPLAAFCTLLAPFTAMLFHGDEYGEPAPFQFFSDHIDKRIAQATREGRRREFAAFAAFSGKAVPDPQDEQTFERSKLTRRKDDRLLALHRDLLRARRALPQGDVTAHGDEQDRTLRVGRGDYLLAMNFAREPREVCWDGDPHRDLLLATHDADVRSGCVALPPLSGALLR